VVLIRLILTDVKTFEDDDLRPGLDYPKLKKICKNIGIKNIPRDWVINFCDLLSDYVVKANKQLLYNEKNYQELVDLNVTPSKKVSISKWFHMVYISSAMTP
jgi:hypothetical protein